MLPSHDQKKKDQHCLSVIEVFSPEKENTSTNAFSKRCNNDFFFFLDKHKMNVVFCKKCMCCFQDQMEFI